MLWTCHELMWCLMFAHIKLAQYLQNSSKPPLSQNCGISKQWIETKHWSDKSSGSERHVDICLSSLSLSHFPSFYFLPCSDQRDRNPPQQLSVQTDSVKDFPSIFLSLTHTHIHKSLPFSFAHKCTSPLTHLYQTSQGLCVCQGVLSVLNRHASPAHHRNILQSALLALTYRFTWKW